MRVKTIFNVLLGTIVITVMSSLILEVINICLTSMQIHSVVKMSVRQACVYFGQETYKRDDFESIGMNDIYARDGSYVLGGMFYPTPDKDAIYNSLYVDNDEFNNWANGTNIKNKWSTLDNLSKAINQVGVMSSLERMMGDYYKEAKMTPLNLGVTYLDRSTIQKISRWNTATIFNNGVVGDSDEHYLNVYINDYGTELNGEAYVLYKGFRIFMNRLEINDIEYRVYDLRNTIDRDEFSRLTNMDPNVLLAGVPYDDDRNRVCIAGIEYSVPVQYEGLTPMRRVFQYALNSRVEGANNRAVDNIDIDTINYNDFGTAMLKGGGFTGTGDLVVDTTPVPSRLIYYVVR